MSGNNKGKKPKIFVKKRPDKIDAVHDLSLIHIY